MNTESPFFYPPDDEHEAVEFYVAKDTEHGYRTVQASISNERELNLDLTAAAIAGVLHLYEKPTEDLHGYTEYLEEAKAWLVSRETSGFTVEFRPRDPLAALGIE